MNRNLIYAAPILVIILIGIWGYYLYSQYGNNLFRDGIFSRLTNQNQNSGTTPKVPSEENTVTSFNTEDDILRFFDNPPQEMTPEQRQLLYAGLDRLGKETDTITVNNCKNTPAVAKVRPEQDFKMVNDTQVDYTMRFAKKDFVLSGGQSVSLTAPAQSSFYVVRCTANEAMRNDDPIPGIVYVVPQ